MLEPCNSKSSLGETIVRPKLACLLLSLLLVGLTSAQETLDVYIGSDTNISDWWSNTVAPAFEASNPDYRINVVVTGGSGEGNDPIADRAFAALETGDDPQVDMFEDHDPFRPEGSIDAGLWTEFSAENVPSYGTILDAAKLTPYNLPYRGSQVLLAYDSTKVAEEDVPHTWDELIAWIEANPGQFIYGRPDRGGSGRNFVVRAIHEANGRDPSLFTVDNFDPAEAEAAFAGGWEILNDLAPSLYDNAAYPAGNTPTLQLLAQGAVSMVPAWSDQALQAISVGALPDTIRLVQLEDLPFCGGYAAATIPTNAAHQEGALALAEFLLSPEMQTSVVEEIGGFPAVSWDTLSEALQQEFTDVIAEEVPVFPSGDWEAAMNDGWYSSVATGLSPDDE